MSGRDPGPSQILAPTGRIRGALWASGFFAGFQQFQQDHDIGLVINCLTHGDGEVLAIEEPEGRLTRLQYCMKLVAKALVDGRNVLVHCKHGVHRNQSNNAFHCLR